MEAWAAEILKTYGLAGLVIAALAGVVVVLWKSLNKATAARLEDSRQFHKLAGDATTALNAITAVAVARNEITDELGHAFERQGAAVERLTDRLEYQLTAQRDELSRHGIVIAAVSQSVQVTSGIITDLRNALEKTNAELKDAGAVIAELDKAIGRIREVRI